ncbi:DNA primase small subunit [mine drainage metagenome]|uniref:DNA primase small subunit n=1 Tax=mine drainage metagenome TaxID=410659 RepID=T1A6W2_9ZZZZ
MRFPGSLHGKTGLKVVKIPIDDLTGFNPLSDAIPTVFKSGEVTVNAQKKIEMRFGGEDIKIEGKQKVKKDLGIFLISSGRATLE